MRRRRRKSTYAQFAWRTRSRGKWCEHYRASTLFMSMSVCTMQHAQLVTRARRSVLTFRWPVDCDVSCACSASILGSRSTRRVPLISSQCNCHSTQDNRQIQFEPAVASSHIADSQPPHRMYTLHCIASNFVGIQYGSRSSSNSDQPINCGILSSSRLLRPPRDRIRFGSSSAYSSSNSGPPVVVSLE
jgi:hypothetical protein